MTDIADKLRWHATDWNGSQLADGEPAKDNPTAGTMRKAADELDKLRSQKDRLRNIIDRVLWRADSYEEEITSWEKVIAEARREIYAMNREK